MLLALFVAACHHAVTNARTSNPGAAAVLPAPPAPNPSALLDNTPPAMLLGSFQDDYQGSYTLSANEFVQGPRAHYHIVQWHTLDQYFIAHNDAMNASDANKWTRIDWLLLSGMTPYEWAFCFTAYDAGTQAAAESTPPANRSNPRTGCNKFPFSRMRLISP